MIEVEVQNETDQSQRILRFQVVPRIGEGVRLLDARGFWTSFDVLDVWYQKAQWGDVWIPYIHVRKTEDGPAAAKDAGSNSAFPAMQGNGSNGAAA